MEISIIHKRAAAILEELDVASWPIWSHEEAVFPWRYDDTETCFFLAGEVLVTPQGGQPTLMGQGDLVTFPQGLECTREIRKAVRKHYKFT